MQTPIIVNNEESTDVHYSIELGSEANTGYIEFVEILINT